MHVRDAEGALGRPGDSPPPPSRCSGDGTRDCHQSVHDVNHDGTTKGRWRGARNRSGDIFSFACLSGRRGGGRRGVRWRTRKNEHDKTTTFKNKNENSEEIKQKQQKVKNHQEKQKCEKKITLAFFFFLFSELFSRKKFLYPKITIFAERCITQIALRTQKSSTQDWQPLFRLGQLAIPTQHDGLGFLRRTFLVDASTHSGFSRSWFSRDVDACLGLQVLYAGHGHLLSFLRHRVKPRRPHQEGPRGLPHDDPENSKRAFWRPQYFKHHRNSKKRRPERKKRKTFVAGGKKTRNFGLPPFWTHTLLDPLPFWNHHLALNFGFAILSSPFFRVSLLLLQLLLLTHHCWF